MYVFVYKSKLQKPSYDNFIKLNVFLSQLINNFYIETHQTNIVLNLIVTLTKKISKRSNYFFLIIHYF